uniref:Uncharacterized protein n=1 Tax=Panagrolaimus sp. ES5 TaxID=591445 RepID=A0AC34GPR2_9BILA
MNKFLFFAAVTVTLLFNFSHGFHAKLLVRKDGFISADGLKGYSNFEKTCIKDDYCTYSMNAPGIAPTNYTGDQNVISKDGQDLNSNQDKYNQGVQNYADFENGWKNTSDEIESMLKTIESINKQLPSILDAIENSILATNETYQKIETALGQVSLPCYKDNCAKTTQGPETTTQNSGTQATDVTSSPGSTAEPGTTTEFTGSTPSPGPTDAPTSTVSAPTETFATGGSTADSGPFYQ